MKFHIKYLLLICVLLAGASFNSAWADVYDLVTSAGDLTAGDIILIVDSKTDGSAKALSGYKSQASVTVSSSSITIATPGAESFTLGGNSSAGWSFKNTSNKYVSYSGSGTSLSETNSASGNALWTISINGTSNIATITVKGGNRMIRRYSTTDFRAYQNTSNGADVYIYKKRVNIPVTGISVSPTSTSVGVGGTVDLTATITPNNATDKAVTWTSSDETKATVSSSGVVTGVAAGDVTITATAHGDNTKTATCTITVTAKVPVTSVSLNKSSTDIYIGSTETLEATVSPNDATIKTISWESSNNSIATVENGVVTAVAVGTTTITAKSTDDPTKSASCAVTVSPIAVTGVTLNKTSIRLLKDATETLTATVSPANATNKTVTWTSSNEDVATVTSEGVVTAKAVGTATITVTTEDGSKTATCTVKVTDGSIDLTESGTITFNTFSQDLLGGSYASSTRNCNLTASDGNVYIWKEVNGIYQSGGWQLKASTGVATSPSIKSDYGFTISTTKKTNNVIISDGTNSGQNSLTTTKTNATITIMGDGTYAVFTAITITPLKPTRSVTFPDGDQEITVDGSTITKTATVSPMGTVTYSSSNTAVATVNSTTGEVTAVKGGSAVITATVAADDDYRESTGSYTVTVNKAATTLAFTNDEETVELVDGTATFTATATPADGSRTILILQMMRLL